ncbi:MAG: LacI family transcriptional regulator [Treponema sp.]|nr:LacI family transcriptional regulator [Treponema sp.]
MVTLKDIADEAGVSIATVSNVINGNLSKVSNDNAKRIRAIIENRHYVPNSSARTLAVKSSHIIAGILMGAQGANMLKDPYCAEFFGELVGAVQDRGYYFMVRYVTSYDEVIKSLRSWNVDGAVFIGTSEVYSRKIQEEIHIPLIFTDSYTTQQNINNVGIDDFKGGVLAAEYFLKMGHRNLSFVGYTYPLMEKSVVPERLGGFLSVFKSHNIEMSDKQFFYVPESAPDDCLNNIASQLMEDNGGITGFFVSADKLAFALIRTLSNNGIKVPQDISVIGFDDLSITSDFMPGLTTIRQNISRKVQIVADLLFRQIEGDNVPPVNTMLDVELIERGSVKFLSKKRKENT